MSEIGILAIVLAGGVVVEAILAILLVTSLAKMHAIHTKKTIVIGNSHSEDNHSRTRVNAEMRQDLQVLQLEFSLVGLPIDLILTYVSTFLVSDTYVAVVNAPIATTMDSLVHSTILFLAVLGGYWVLSHLLIRQTPGQWLAHVLIRRHAGGKHG